MPVLRTKLFFFASASCFFAWAGPAAADSFEPNDDFLEGRALSPGVPISANIAHALDVDWFVFATGQAGEFSLRLTSVPSNADYVLEFFQIHEDGTATLLLPTEDKGGLGDDETIEGNLSGAAFFGVAVSGFGGTFNASDTYVLTTTFPPGWPGGGSDGNEPNDDPTVATVLSANQAKSALISRPGDLDYYEITLAEAGPLGIQVTSMPPTADYDVRLYYRDGTGSYLLLATSVREPGQDEAIAIPNTGVPGTFYVVVYGYAGSFHTSDTYSIVASFTGGGGNEPPMITLTSPNGGESWQTGSVHAITWNATDPDATDALSIDLEYSTSNGATWTPIIAGLPDNGTFSWTVPDTPSTQSRVRATVSDGVATAEDASNSSFSIVSVPAGENTLAIGSGSGSAGGQVSVPMTLDNEDIVAGLQSDLVFDPAVLQYVSGEASQRGANLSYSAALVASNRLRVVLYYETTETLPAGQGIIASLTFSLIGSSGTSSAIAPGPTVLSGPGGIQREVTNQAGSISVVGGGAASPVVVLSAPNGGETWQAGTEHSIVYTATDDDTPSNELTIRYEYSTNGGQAWSTIANDQPNSGSFLWTVPETPTDRARVRVTADDGERTGADESSANFTITAAPDGENTLAIGTGTGNSGGESTIALSLANDDEIAALQTDLTFNPAITSYVASNLAPRTGGMSLDASLVDTNTLRLVLYSESGNPIPPGQGPVANISWSLLAAGQSALDLTGSVLSDPNGNAALVTEQDGSITVTGGTTSNTLSLGTASGASGTGATVTVDLDNEDIVKRIEFDVAFDPSVATFTSIASTGRGGSFAATSQTVSAGLIRLTLDTGAGTPLSVGSGQIASLAFDLIGANGTNTGLAVSDLRIMNPAAEEVPSQGSNGQLNVLGGGTPPALRLAAFKNPGRERTLQVFLTTDQALLSTPTVMAGATPVTMTLLDPVQRIYLGSVAIGNESSSVTFQAQGVGTGGTGQASLTVSFVHSTR